MSDKVVFLDYDGVVNTPMWNEAGTECRYGMPYDNKVNNFQAVQWVSEFCQKYGYSIVVTSTWRVDKNWKECLINGGLREGVEVIDRVPIMHDRGEEILSWLFDHPEVQHWLIFDDDTYDLSSNQYIRCVKTRPDVGFMEDDFNQAVVLHKAFNVE